MERESTCVDMEVAPLPRGMSEPALESVRESERAASCTYALSLLRWFLGV